MAFCDREDGIIMDEIARREHARQIAGMSGIKPATKCAPQAKPHWLKGDERLGGFLAAPKWNARDSMPVLQSTAS